MKPYQRVEKSREIHQYSESQSRGVLVGIRSVSYAISLAISLISVLAEGATMEGGPGKAGGSRRQSTEIPGFQ